MSKFTNIEDVKDYVIEKEVESVLRESHSAQFQWLEKKLKIPFTKDLDSFSSFIEITERRNLFVHCNGVVSRQYLNICQSNKIKDIDKISVGDQLDVTPKYLFESYNVFYEIGVKLGHVLWRKLKPEERKDADNCLNNLCFDLLSNKQYKLALNLLNFATDTLKTYFSEEIKYMFIINKALAYYLLEDKVKCDEVLNNIDFSALDLQFKFANNVLSEKYDLASNNMKDIGDNGIIKKEFYQLWPLFTKFRETEIFKTTYLQIFQEGFMYIESKPQNLEDLLEDAKELRKEFIDLQKENV